MLPLKIIQPFGRLSRVKTTKQKTKFYESRPELFRRIQIMDPPNLHPDNKDLTFPLNITLRHQYIRRHSKKQRLLLEHLEAQTIRFKPMGGNQILLNLENHSQLKPAELMGALLELYKRAQSVSLEQDWNEHPTLQEVVATIKSGLAHYDSREVATCCLNSHLLGLTDLDLWANLQKQMLKCLPTMNKQQFLCVFKAFMVEQPWTNSEIKERLVQLLPIHLHRMSAKNIALCWDLCVQHGLLSDYLFHEHFIMLVWKRHSWFGVKYLAHFISELVNRQGYLQQDSDFWLQELLPHMPGMFQRELSPQSVRSMIQALSDLGSLLPESLPIVELLLEEANTQLQFIEGSYQVAKKNSFTTIVQNDLAYYRQQHSI